MQNRLISVTKGGVSTATFAYTAGGQRVKTERPGRVIYTPFPGYEEEIGTLPAVALTADEEETLVLALGDSFSLAWNSSLAESCSTGGSWSGDDKTPQGSQVMTPASSGLYTYTLVCSNEYGDSEMASVTVDVGERPSVTITADGLTNLAVPVNQSFTLAWQSSGAVGLCSADGSWSGNKNQNGSQTLSHATSGSYSYELTCTNTYGSTSATATVTVYLVPALEMSINGQTQSPYIVSVNQPFSLNWSGVLVENCQASGAWSGSKPYKGNQQESQAVAGSYTYSLSCEAVSASGLTWELTAQVTVEVVPLPSLDFTVNRQSSIYIDPDQPFTLEWESANATSCTASNSMGGSEIEIIWQGNKPLSGSEVLAMDIPGSHEFILTCFNAAGTPVSQTVTVVVEQEGCVCLPVDGIGLLGGNPPGEKQIERLTLSLAGQPVAVKVSGQVTERNGIYYFMGDHLGSSNVLVDQSDNSIVPGSRTFYQPFGGYRGDLPDQGLTDQGYTGHKHNMDLGLVYMNARYYLPGTGRFASADTLVPDPMNPQQFNRYTYVGNRPLNFNDPTGHCGADVTADGLSNVDALHECLGLRDFILNRYGVFAGGAWKLQELSAFAHGLFDMVEGMGGLNYFRAAFSNVSVIRERGKWADGDGNLGKAESGAPIVFYDGAFQSFDIGRWSTIHEFGHVFDMTNYWNSGLHPDGRLAGWLGLVNRLKGSYGVYSYSPGFEHSEEPGHVVSSYALREGKKEDYAESWAAYHFRGSWVDIGSPRNGWDARQRGNQARRDHIANNITAFQLIVDQK